MYNSSKQFNNKPVVDLSEETTPQDLSAISPMIGIDDYDSDAAFPQLFDTFLKTQDTTPLDSLVIGNWSPDFDLSETSQLTEAMQTIIDNKDKYPALKALFVGNIEQEQSEISWIEVVDYAPYLNKDFQNIEYFRARGEGSFLQTAIQSVQLKKLAFETGGLSNNTIINITKSQLPNLEHLELWIGSEYYGSVTIDDIKSLLNTDKLPKLKYLGLRNCEIIDDVIPLLADSPLFKQVEVLDLSLGNLSNKGAKALAKTDLSHLKKLIIDHHYVENDKLLDRIKSLVPHFSHADRQEADTYNNEVNRYIMVSE